MHTDLIDRATAPRLETNTEGQTRATLRVSRECIDRLDGLPVTGVMFDAAAGRLCFCFGDSEQLALEPTLRDFPMLVNVATAAEFWLSTGAPGAFQGRVLVVPLHPAAVDELRRETARARYYLTHSPPAHVLN